MPVRKSNQVEDEPIDSLNYGEEEVKDDQPAPGRTFKSGREVQRRANGREPSSKVIRQEPKPRTNKNGHEVMPWNDVTISGYTMNSKDLMVTDYGTPYFAFTIKVSQGKGKMPCFMNITMWQDLALKAEREIGDNMRVLVSGRLTQRKAGNGQYYTGIRADYYEIVEE
jgi:hypothetical protein